MGDKILLIGGGGHCKSILDAILASKVYLEIAIIDLKENVGKSILGIPIIGSDENLTTLFEEGYKHAFITLGSIGNTRLRYFLNETVREIGFNIPTVIDPSAIVSKHAVIGEGVFIAKGAIVNAGSIIKTCAIINTGAIVEHDCVIEAFAHIAPGAVLCGDVFIGSNTHIGANAVVRQGISIGSNALVGIGSVVVENIHDDVVAFGNPCREAK